LIIRALKEENEELRRVIADMTKREHWVAVGSAAFGAVCMLVWISLMKGL